MSDLLSDDIATVAEFLAHALELEVESAERYRELAHAMEVHNNAEVAALFHRLSVESDAHLELVRQWGEGYELPKIAPWNFKWSSPEGPESVSMTDTHYQMNRIQALQLALHNEIRARDFYVQVAERASNADVKRRAEEMATEEDSHIGMLKEMLDTESGDYQKPLEDLDPPNMPG